MKKKFAYILAAALAVVAGSGLYVSRNSES
jgi:hypothetical protein